MKALETSHILSRIVDAKRELEHFVIGVLPPRRKAREVDHTHQHAGVDRLSASLVVGDRRALLDRREDAAL